MVKKTGIVSIFIFLISFTTLLASDYSIPEIRVEVTISEDGIVEIHEHRTYRFEGSFSWADYRLPKEGFTEIRNIRVSEGNQSYINENTETQGTFSVSETGKSVVIKWHYSAVDTVRTFTLSYELTDAISVGPQWAEFFWNYVGAGRDKSNDTVQIQVNLPADVPSDSLYTWSRQTTANLARNIENGRFIIHADQVPRNESIRVRTLFPTGVLNENMVSVTDPKLSLELVQQQELEYLERIEQEAEREAFYSAITPGITVLLILISLGVYYYLYQRYGKRHKTGTISDQHTIVIPDNTPPALVGRLLSFNNTSGNHIAATLFDLARRGWFTIEENKKEKTGFFSTESTEYVVKRTGNTPEAELQPWEKQIVDFAEQRIAQGKTTFSKMFKGTESAVSTWYRKWGKSVKETFDEKNWIDTKSYHGLFWNVGFQIILTIIGIWLLVYGGDLAFMAIFCSGIMTLLSFAIIRRTKEGEETYRRWKAYLNGLKNADKRTIRMETVDRHFIYATAFGLSKNQINTLIESTDQTTANLFPWIVLMSGSAQTPASVASSLSALAATGSASFGGTSGGSGASTGSAGGGATGGAG